MDIMRFLQLNTLTTTQRTTPRTSFSVLKEISAFSDLAVYQNSQKSHVEHFWFHIIYRHACKSIFTRCFIFVFFISVGPLNLSHDVHAVEERVEYMDGVWMEKFVLYFLLLNSYSSIRAHNENTVCLNAAPSNISNIIQILSK